VGAVPLFLIGHPYDLNSEAIVMLAAISQLGMTG
jgi:hypothetical protein